MPPLKGLWPTWPETRWSAANVLLEGPSILDLDASALLFGPVVAVNHALSVPAPIDFWATSDSPRVLWGWAAPHRHEELRYFTTDQNLLVWQELLGDALSKVYSQHMTAMDESGPAPVILPTILPVLSWLSRLGVRHVRLFGCDMKGTASPLHSGESFQAESDAGYAWRWRVERTLLAHAIRQYRASGARIERWRKAKRDPRR